MTENEGRQVVFEFFKTCLFECKNKRQKYLSPSTLICKLNKLINKNSVNLK